MKVRAQLRLSACAAAMALAPEAHAQGWMIQRGSVSASLTALHFPTDRIGYVVGADRTILKTRDGGESWSLLSAGFPHPYTDFGAVRFADSVNGLVCGQYSYRTSDGGATWNPIPLSPEEFCHDVEYPEPDAAYLLGYSGKTSGGLVLKSTDRGLTWSVPGPVAGFKYGYFVSAQFLARDTGFALMRFDPATVPYRLMATRDGAATWTELAIGLPPQTLYRDSILSFHFADSRTGYALGWRTGPTARERFTLKTVDAGVTWTRIADPAGGPWTGIRFTHPDTGWVWQGDSLSETRDGGETWQGRSFRSVRTMQAVHMRSPRLAFASGTMGQVLRTQDGQRWAESFPILSPLDLQAVHFPRPDTGYAAGMAGEFLRTTDGGRRWEDLASGPGRFANFQGLHFQSALQGCVVGGDSGSIQRTVDGGATWTRPSGGSDGFLAAVHFPDAATGFAVGAAGAAIKTTDGGANWVPLSTGSTRNLRSVHFPEARTGYAAGDSGTLLKTVDGGAQWTVCATGISTPFYSVRFLDAARGFACGPGPVLIMTADGGKTWSPRTAQPPSIVTRNGALRAIAFADNLRGVAVGDGHLWSTADGGETWTRTDMPGSFPMLAADYGFGALHLAGEGSRIFGLAASGPIAIHRRAPRPRTRAPAAVPNLFRSPDGTLRELRGRALGADHPAIPAGR